MRKYLIIIVLILGMVVTLIPWGTQKVLAQDNVSPATTIGFTIDPAQPGQLLQPGSVIYELNSGVTEVYGPDGTLTLSVMDSQSAAIPTSNGNILADHAFTVSDGSNVVNTGKEIDIYSQNNLILKVIDQNVTQSTISTAVSQNVNQPATDTHAWVEQARNSGNNPLPNIDYFSADWTVPAVPSDTTTQTVYIFNAFQSPSAPGSIIQPVLEWNRPISPGVHSGGWTGAAWYMSGGTLIRDNTSPVTNIAVGDSINGSLSYDHDASQWVVIFNDITKTEISMGINDPGMTTSGIQPYLAYEMWSPDPTQPTYDCSSYMPGDCTFTNIVTKYSGNSFNVNWEPYYTLDAYPNGASPYPPCLSGLQVVGAYQGTSSITLKTTYTPALSVSTNAATNITNDQVTLNGTLNNLGSASSGYVSFVYATDNYWNANNNNYQTQISPSQNMMNSPGTFSCNLTGLSPNTTYHYKAEAEGNGTMFGDDQTFTTGAVITEPASNITSMSATLNAYLNGGSARVEGFVLDTVSHPTAPTGSFDPVMGQGGYDVWRWFQKDDITDPVGEVMADCNSDNRINIADTALVGLYWGDVAPNLYSRFYRADVNGDGKINITDTAKIGLYWGDILTYSNYPIGSFSVNLASPPNGTPITLTPGTTYYYRAFASGSWGNEVSFITP